MVEVFVTVRVMVLRVVIPLVSVRVEVSSEKEVKGFELPLLGKYLKLNQNVVVEV
jgi:hypothetical protein